MTQTEPQPPFGLEQRLQLSQLSQHETSVDLLNNHETDDFPCNNDPNGDSDTSAADMLRIDDNNDLLSLLSDDDQNGESTSDPSEMSSEADILQRAEVAKILSQPGGPYSLLSVKFQTITENIVTVEQGFHAMDAMDKLIADLMRMSFARQGASAIAGIVSLPTNNKKTSQHVRLRKASSPPRKKRAMDRRKLAKK